MTRASRTLVGRASKAAYVAILVLATLSPFVLRLPDQSVGSLLRTAFHPGLTVESAVDGVRNVVLFAGWGLLWVLSPQRGGRRRWLRLVAGAVVTGLALSVSLETIQIFVPTRTTSILDVLTNTVGSALGGAVGVGLVVAARLRRGAPDVLGVPAFPLAFSYGTALLFESAFPLLRTGFPGTYGGPATRLAWSLRHLSPKSVLHVPLLDGVLFLPLGFLVVAALVEAGLGYRRAAAWATLGGAVIAVLGEGAHLILAQPVVLGAVLVHAVAPAIGALLAVRLLPALTRRRGPRGRAALFLVGYVVVLTLWLWRPFDFRAVPSVLGDPDWWRRLVPMATLGARSDLDSVSEVLVDFFLFVPVGTVLAAWPLRRGHLFARLVPALLLSLFLEAGQMFVASRFVDLTDALIAFAGAAVAWAVLHAAEYPVRGALLD